MSLLETALQFAAHGVPIFPVRVYRVGNRWRKEPHIKKWAARATTNPATIKAWWREWPDAFVGVPLERVGLVVVDADRHRDGPDGVAVLQGIELPPHQFVSTDLECLGKFTGGQHHFFRQPTPPIDFVAWEGGQVLGHGRMVVAYALAPFITPAPVLPRDLLDRLPRAKAGNGKNTTTHRRPFIGTPSPTGSTFLRSKYLILDLERATAGNRHCLQFWTACRFGNMIGEGKFKSREVAEHLLIEAAKVNGDWYEDPDDCLRTIRDGLREGEEEWIAWNAGKRAAGGVLEIEAECRD
jgi:hypothetical protein